MKHAKDIPTTLLILYAILATVMLVWSHHVQNTPRKTPPQPQQTDPNTLLPPHLKQPQPAVESTLGKELTALILEYNTPLTLANTLRSYTKHKMLHYVNETILYIQETTPAKRASALKYHNVRPIGTEKNTKLHIGLDALVQNASTEFVLFLEKDWELIENEDIMRQQLDTAIKLVKDGVADVVRLRSRAHPGWDFYAKETYQGREEKVFSAQPNLLCNFYHWIDDPAARWPFAFKRCHSNPDFLCVKAEYCNWTNNPVVFRKSWWIENMSQWANYANLEARFTNFENLLNNIPKSWNTQPHTVALGHGLFLHHEIDG